MYQSIADEFLERKWTTHKKDNKLSQMLTHEGRVMWQTHGSYSSFLRSEKVAQKKAQRSKIVPDVIKIGSAIIFGLSTATLAWLKYFDDKEIHELKRENQILIETVDSLTKEIETLKVPQIVVPSDSSKATEIVKEKK